LKFTATIFLIPLLLIFNKYSAAQQTVPIVSTQDTIRVIQIIKAKNLYQKTIDSATTIEAASGDVVIKEGLTTTYCDSVVMNHRTNLVEAFGNVHINDNDSIHTYAQSLKYMGGERIAYLKKNVRLTDKKGVLLTDDLEYNLRTGIATYKDGGKVLNGKTVLTSTEGVYYADTKDVYFKKNVHLVDPKYDIRTDSLLYNIANDIATFIAPSHIVSKDGIIDTKSGIYNLKTGEAIFYDRSYIRDSSRSIIGDKIFFDDKKGIVTADGNAKVVDSINQVTTIANHIEVNTKENSFLAYNKPVMILHKDNDSTYIAADTLFSGLRKYDSTQKKQLVITDTIKKSVVLNINKKDTAVRYFLAFHHVRIFNDSLQSVSDSLYYSTADSTFQLFGQPLVWNGKSQIAGDTIYMYTQNQKAKRLYVFFNGIIINQTADQLYNQIAGRTLDGYFKDGTIDYVRVKGSPAESIFYPQDDDSAYIGMNRSSGDVIDIYFVNKELNKVKFINNVDGVMYPIRQTPADKKRLKNFKWLDNRRPKNKLELFE
jgi:lipopolysaccharide export system protein LptA